MNLFIPKEQGMIHFLMRMHPKEGILSETNLSVSSWVKPTIEAFIHSNQFLHYERDNNNPCPLELPRDRREIDEFYRKLKASA